MQPTPDLFMPIYVGDFLRSTLDWEGPEKGAYLLLLITQWSVGSIPACPRTCARLHAIDVKTFNRLWKRLEGKFPLCPDGLRRNPTLERIREKTSQKLEVNRRRGKAGADARWGKDRCLEHPPSIAPAMASDIDIDLRGNLLPSSQVQGTTGPVDNSAPKESRRVNNSLSDRNIGSEIADLAKRKRLR